MIPSLAFQYQHQCLVAYKDLTHHAGLGAGDASSLVG